MAELKQRISIRDTLEQMAIGETIGIAFSIVTSGTIRGAASIIGMEKGRLYTVHANRNNQMYEITRYE